MKVSNDLNCPSRFWLCFAGLLIIAGVVAMVLPFQAAGGELLSATYSRGILHVTIPYRALRAGQGQLILEVLDPEDGVLGKAERNLEVAEGRGRWQEEIKLDKPVALEDLVWNRMRYRFVYNDGRTEALEGTESIAQIIRTPVVHILGQQSYLTGGQAAIRVIVTDSRNEVIAGSGSVRIELLAPQQKTRLLFSGRLNHRGTTEAQIQFPADLVGNYQLRYIAETPIGSTEFTQSVRLEDKVSILLTTEKPIYQPGQTIHVRALALDRSDHQAAANHKLTFEVEDSRGNKVFKKATQTDKFGIASAEFGLADEVNLGTYHLRALMGESDAAPANTAEIALNVERYVLPKFKVAVDLSGKDHKSKRGYRPGDHVSGTVQANYFFGKPVDGADIKVKASGMDVSVYEITSMEGKTDNDGAYHFELELPKYFAGHPLTQGAARVLIEATVKDSAGHAETRGEPITVSESPLLITAVPEGGTLVPNLENQVFILASYPDGKPASAELNVHAEGNSDQHVTTDDGGVAIVRINVAKSEKLEIEAEDREGNHTKSTVELQARDGLDQILLRTERAVYRAGDRIQLRVFSSKKQGTAYVDIVKEGQTVLTRDLDIVNGQAELSLIATPEMAGTVDFNAYLFGRDARPVGDHRLVFVQPADELKIEARTENAVYRPGEDARVRFHVTNSRCQGVQAALGLQVVDEAVFALAEKQPGFAKVFFYLEQEVMKPRYEIHSIGMPDIVEPVEKDQVDQRDRAARALFSATEMVTSNKFETEFGRTVPSTKLGEYQQRYETRFLAQVRQISQDLSRAYAQGPDNGDLAKAIARMKPVSDAWGTYLRIEPLSWGPPKTYYLVRAAGPDKRFQTDDDMAAYLEFHRRKIVSQPSSGENSVDFKIEHDRGPFNGRAEIQGTAVDQWGGALEGATVKLREVTTGRTRTARANAGGRFTLSSLPAGDYVIEISTKSETVSSKLTLDARDRAAVSVFLRHEASGDVVTFNAEFGRFGGGIVNGIAGARMEDMERRKAVPAPMPQMAMNETVEVESAAPMIQNSATLTRQDAASPHVRSYFPEALYINPEIITDNNGLASISIPLADSITTWRMALVASTQHGALGSATSSLKVFQDFFVDLDLPVTLTQGDRISIPVA
ncbi:MAG TPA: MG2 domain-containing protein, partial [Candidatus Angelobacter sp.]